MQRLLVAGEAALTQTQTVLVAAGCVLAITAAVVTNVIAARRGLVKQQLDEGVVEIQDALSRTHTAMAQSLEANRSARSLWAMVELRPVPPDAFYESYFHSVVGWLAQAGMDAISGLGIEVDAENPTKTAEVRTLLEAQRNAATQGPAALQGLVDACDDLRQQLVPRSSHLSEDLKRKVADRSRHERQTVRLLALGTSVQILSLVAIAAKDLV
jgi:hypothetical protein